MAQLVNDMQHRTVAVTLFICGKTDIYVTHIQGCQ